MNDIFKHIFEFIFFKTRKNSAKLFYILLAVIILLLLNDYTRFTRNIIINSKLNQLEKLKNIDSDVFNNDPLVKEELVSLKMQILDKRTFAQAAKRFISAQFEGILTWRNFSACFFCILFFIVTPFRVFSNNKLTPKHKLVFMLSVALNLFLYSFIFIKLFGLIPDFRYPIFNHLLNLLLQVISFIIIAAIMPEPKPKTKRTFRMPNLSQ